MSTLVKHIVMWLVFYVVALAVSYFAISPILTLFLIPTIPLMAIMDYVSVIAYRNNKDWNNISDNDIFMQQQMKQQTNHLRDINAQGKKKP